MMVDSMWIKTSLFLILELQFTVSGQHVSYVVRDGDDVTLSCENTRDWDKCEDTTWNFLNSTNSFYLVTSGNKINSPKSDRLSLTQTCSLDLKKVSDQDVGRYDCQQSKPEQYPHNVLNHLSVVSMTEQKVKGRDDEVVLSCSVSVYRNYHSTVKLLYDGKTVSEGNSDFVTSASSHSATVTFPSSYLMKPQLFQCEVTDGRSLKVHQFTFRAPPSDKETTTTTRNGKDSQINTPASGNSDSSLTTPSWWLYAAAAAASVVILITVTALILWRRERKKSQTNENYAENTNQRRRLNSTDTQSGPETSQDMVAPDVSYATVSYIKKTSRTAQVKDDDDNEGDAVTYSTLKDLASLADASTDPGHVYAVPNK